MTEGPRLTRRELDVMSILWRKGSGTVGEVREVLHDELAYTTVLWVLQTLEQKGFVRHEKEGRAHRYHPTIAREAAGGSALSRIMDKVFHGSAAMLLAQLVREAELPPEELRRMRELLDRRLAEAGEADDRELTDRRLAESGKHEAERPDSGAAGSGGKEES